MLVVFQCIMNELLIIVLLLYVMHQEETDFHQVIFVDHQNQLIVEYVLKLVVIHYKIFLIVELVKLLTKIQK
jgi:hypothetical protein